MSTAFKRFYQLLKYKFCWPKQEVKCKTNSQENVFPQNNPTTKTTNWSIMFFTVAVHHTCVDFTHEGIHCPSIVYCTLQVQVQIFIFEWLRLLIICFVFETILSGYAVRIVCGLSTVTLLPLSLSNVLKWIMADVVNNVSDLTDRCCWRISWSFH